jgi:DNA-binding CsgD family transcriptional regulator
MQDAFRKKPRLTSEAFESLLDEIYAAGEDHRHWTKVLAVLASHLSSQGGGLHSEPLDGKGFSFGTTYGATPIAESTYAEYYYSINPLHAPLSRVPVGSVVPDHHLVSRRDIARTEFFNDFSRISGLGGSMTLVLARDHLHESCITVMRAVGADIYTEEQAAFLQRLAPHLRRAIDLNRRLMGLENKVAGLETALGSIETAVFVLDRAGVICYSNAAGEKLVEKRDGLNVRLGRLFSDDPSAQNSLAELLQKALTAKGARGGSVSVPRRYSKRPLLLRVMPVPQSSEYWLNSAQPCAILFISDPDSRTAADAGEAMDAYGLTSSERKLLNELVAGRTLREAAEILNITRATSRNRLARIMAKTDTHRQSELIQLILRSSVPLR